MALLRLSPPVQRLAQELCPEGRTATELKGDLLCQGNMNAPRRDVQSGGEALKYGELLIRFMERVIDGAVHDPELSLRSRRLQFEENAAKET
jgi:hypothetical protein